MALRAALWTIGTSGKALHDCKTTAFNSYRNLVSTEVCTNNKKTVLLNVLLYCPGSTVPGYALYVQKVTALQSLSLVFAFMLKGEGQTSGEMWEFRNVQRDVL